MKNLALAISCVMVMVTLSACGTAFPVAAFTVGAAGTAINVENSGNPVDSPGEAKDRIVADVKKGYSGEITPDGRYGPTYKVNP